MLRKVGPWTFFKRLVREVDDDGVFTIAAAVAFYWLFAFFPLLIFMLSLLPLLPEGLRAGTQEQITAKVKEWAGPGSAGDTVNRQIEGLLDPHRPRAGLVSIGMLLTLWAASNGIKATMSALDTCYDIEKGRGFLAQRGVAVVMTIGFVIAILGVLLLIPISGLALALLERNLPAEQLHQWLSTPMRVTLDIARYTIGLLLVMLLISSIYQFGVSVRRRWTLITPGAVFAVLIVLGTGWGFSFYIEKMGQKSYDQTYGAVGGIIILLLLFYFYAVAFLVGAEINSEIDFEIVGLRDEPPTTPGDTGEQPAIADEQPELKKGEDLERYKRELIERRRGG